MKLGILCTICILVYDVQADPVPIVVTDNAIRPVKQLWTSTGLCPPDPHQQSHEYFISDDMRYNLKLIGALPYNSFQVRIHWLLDLVSVDGYLSTSEPIYNFSLLDDVINMLTENHLRIGFEIMGNPSNIFNNFEDDVQIQNWYKLVFETVTRYKQQAIDNQWNFESWNEPDTHDYDGLNFTTQGFLNYFDASEKGVHDVIPDARFGGPADSCPVTNTSKLCWRVIDHVAKGINYFTKSVGTRIDFLSFHEKGANKGKPGNSSAILAAEKDVLNLLAKVYPELNNVTVYNDESDPVIGWDIAMEFRADTRYPAMVAKILYTHLYSTDPHIQRISMLSNDNAFLSYMPNIFTQRTLFARFQVNSTATPFVAMIRKPIYEFIAILSQMKGNLTANYMDRENKYVGAITTKNENVMSVLVWTSNDTELYNGDKIVAMITVPPHYTKYNCTIRMFTQEKTTYKVWQDLGEPGNLTTKQLEALWGAQTMDIWPPTQLDINTFPLFLDVPSITQIVFCTQPITELSAPGNLSFISLPQPDMVMIIWDDEQSDCHYTYEVFYTCCATSRWQKISSDSLLTRAFQYASSNGVIGYYRVNSVSIQGAVSTSAYAFYHGP